MRDSIIQSYKEAIAELGSYPELRAFAAGSCPEERLFVLAIGKAAWQMANVYCNALKGIAYSGIVLTKYKHSHGEIPKMSILEAGHPLPDESSLVHTETILKTLQALPPETRLVVLISGGGSALFEKPAGGMSLSELRRQSLFLQNSGMAIEELNRWRIEHSEVKGGKALRYVSCRRIDVLVVSDIRGNPPHLIASGPFYPGGEPTDLRVDHRILADNQKLKSLLSERLRQDGYRVLLDEEFYALKAEAMAELILSRIEQWQGGSGILILGGECPVEVKGAGTGGRCTHLALLLAERIAGMKGFCFIALASDGTDGPTDAAGAIVDWQTAAQVDLRGAVQRFDSYTALDRAGALIKTGATGTNVNDVYLIVRVWGF